MLFIFLSTSVSYGVDVFPGVTGHGTNWTLLDAPGGGNELDNGNPILCIIDDIDGGYATGEVNADYNGTGVKVWEGDALYCINLDNGDNGKVIINNISGTINKTSKNDKWPWYFDNCSWTIMDFNQQTDGDGLLFRNISFDIFDSATEVDHLAIRNLRSFHGAGANGNDGGSNTIADSSSSRKTLTLSADTGKTFRYFVLDHSTFMWGLESETVFGTYGGIGEYATISNTIFAEALEYDSSGDWEDSTSYTIWQLIMHNGLMYECRETHISGTDLDEPGVGNNQGTYWYQNQDLNDDREGSSIYAGLNTGPSYVSYINNFNSHSTQRNPLAMSINKYNFNNNISYNHKWWGIDFRGKDQYLKGDFSYNINIGGPQSGISHHTEVALMYEWSASGGGNYWKHIVIDSETVTSATSTTLTVAGTPWTPNALVGHSVIFTDNSDCTACNGNDIREIESNTDNDITIVESSWPNTPVSSDNFDVVDFSGHDLYIAYNASYEYEAGTASSGSTTTLSDTDDLSGDAVDYWNGGTIYFTSGSNDGLSRTITDFNSTTDTIYWSSALPIAVSNGDSYRLSLTRDQADLPNPYDWWDGTDDIVDTRYDITESAVAHTESPTDALPSGYSPMTSFSTIESSILNNVGAYIDNRDSETQRVLDDLENRVSVKGLRNTVTDSDYPTITTGSSSPLDLPENMWNDDDSDGYKNLEEWIHGTYVENPNTNQIWPGLYGWGTNWSMQDAPGGSNPIICIVNDLSDVSSGATDNSYGPNNVPVYKGTLKYCIGLDNGKSGKYILNAVSGIIVNADNGTDWTWSVDKCDWTIWDMDPPGAPSDGVLITGVRFDAFDADGQDLSHLYMRDIREFNGAWDGECGVGNSINERNSFQISDRDKDPTSALTHIVLDHATLAWNLSGIRTIMSDYDTTWDDGYATVANSIFMVGVEADEGEVAIECDMDTETKGYAFYSRNPDGPYHISYFNNIEAHNTYRMPLFEGSL